MMMLCVSIWADDSIDSVGRHQKISIDDEDVDEVSFFLVTSMHDWIGFMKSFARVEYCK